MFASCWILAEISLPKEQNDFLEAISAFELTEMKVNPTATNKLAKPNVETQIGVFWFEPNKDCRQLADAECDIRPSHSLIGESWGGLKWLANKTVAVLDDKSAELRPKPRLVVERCSAGFVDAPASQPANRPIFC